MNWKDGWRETAGRLRVGADLEGDKQKTDEEDSGTAASKGRAAPQSDLKSS